ncbi:MAG: 6-phosphofructokinase [Bdellovibrionales bacterium]|nr:6-phosphofructokinase [Bdellovibrionales bacterium]
MSTKIIGLLTGGGDCPGLNAVIRAVVRRSLPRGYECLGLLDGWQGLLENRTLSLDPAAVRGIIHVGGTILGTSRTNVLKDEATIQKAFENFKKLNLHALIAIGGEGTLYVSNQMSKRGMPIVGVPKTIDNDIFGTDFTFGFDTAVETATEAIDRLHTTAESHKRVMVVEVMGRHAGWIATYSGLAGGADVVVVPEFPMEISDICLAVENRKKQGKRFSIVVVAEGAKLKKDGVEYTVEKDRKDAFGRPQLGGIGQALANEIEDRTGIESRVTVLGHVQRGGTPTAHDRVLATRLGAYAADLVHQQKWGYMSALHGDKIEAVRLEDSAKKLKTVDLDLWELASSFFG